MELPKTRSGDQEAGVLLLRMGAFHGVLWEIF